MGVIGIDHVQLAMPAGGEERARGFYAGVLGLREIPKPADLARPGSPPPPGARGWGCPPTPPALGARGGGGYHGGAAHIHLGVEQDFQPAHKAHPALLVDDLEAFVARLTEAGVAFASGKPLDGYVRGDVADPFGNRIELMQRL